MPIPKKWRLNLFIEIILAFLTSTAGSTKSIETVYIPITTQTTAVKFESVETSDKI